MSGWKGTTIENIADVKTGPYGSALLNAQYVRGGTPVITVEHIKDFRICQLDYPSVSEEDKARLASYTLEEGDIVFSRVGSVDLSAIAKKENVGWLFSSRMLRVRPNRKKIDPFFLSYYLRLHEVRNYIKKIAVGSTMPSINTEILKSIPVYHFDVEEQKEIAKTLSKLDDKITLLRQQNQTLEELAQTLFKRWFLEFEFPDENGRTYKSSGGRMVESELGEIPEGWRVGCLADEFIILMGQSPAGSSYNDNKEGKVFYQGRTDFGFRFPTNRLYTNEPKRIASKFDVLVSVRAPVGDVNMASEECCIGRGLAAVKSDLKSYCFNKVKSLKKAFDVFENEGTVFGSLSKNDFNSLEVIVPEKQITEKYDQVAFKLDLKIFENTNEIQTLTQLRDTLLPKLMSGEVRVKA